MKRLTAWILAVLMLWQIPVWEAAAKTYDAQNAKNLLVGLKIIGKYDFEPEQILTRGEFAKILVSTLNKTKETQGVTGSQFSDVKNGDEFASQIYYLNGLDIMAGVGNNEFRPYDQLLMRDALKSVVTMLNYGAQAKSRGAYPTGYLNVASDLGITKGLKITSDAPVTIEEAVILLANTLSTEMMQEVFESGKIVYKTVKGEDLLYKAFDGIKGEGVVQANSKTTLSMEKQVAEGTVVIGGVTFNQGATDVDEMLGYYVEYYAVEFDKSSDAEIVYYEVIDAKNEIIEISAKDIEQATTTAQLVYQIGNKSKTAKIAPAADIIYNGVARQGFERWHIMPDSGKVVLFDSDKDGIYDIIRVESYINYVLSGAVKNNYITDKYMQKVIDLNDDMWKEAEIFYAGKPIAVADLKEWDVLSVRADVEKNVGGYREIDFDHAKYLTIYVSREEVGGKLDYFDTLLKTFTIGLSEYYVSENLFRADSSKDIDFKFPATGSSFIAVLDINGMVAAVKVKGFLTMEYGFLIKSMVDTDEEPAAVYLKIYTPTNGVATYPCQEKFRMDGENGVREFWGNELKDRPQLIAFKTNSDGYISQVDTGSFNAAKESKETSLQHNAHYTELRHKSVPRIFHPVGTAEAPLIYINGTCKLFRVPAKADILSNNYTDDDFQMLAVNFFEDNKKYEIDVYNMSDARLPELMVTYVANTVENTVSTNARSILIDKVSIGLDKNDEERVFVAGYYRGDPVSYSFKKMNLLDRYIGPDGTLTIKRGDVILVDANDKNEITAFSVERSFSPDIANTHTLSGTIDSKQTAFGIAYARDNSAFVMRIDGKKAGLDNDLFSVYPVPATKKVALYDAVSNKVSTITVADLMCEKNVGTDRAYLIQVKMAADAEAKDIIAYRMK